MNLGIRFWSCPNLKNKNPIGYGFFEWEEDFIRGRARKVVNALKYSEKRLMRENLKLRKNLL